MGYEHLVNTRKAIALTAPAARAFEMTVEFALGQGKDTATVGPHEGVRGADESRPRHAQVLRRPLHGGSSSISRS